MYVVYIGVSVSVSVSVSVCVCWYIPPSQSERYFIDHLSKTLGQLPCKYDKTVLIGDFNLTIDNKSLEKFMTTFDQA